MCRVASTAIDDPRLATRTVLSQLDLSSLAGVILLCSSSYALDLVAAEITRRPHDCTIIGCTTAGNITVQGFAQNTLTAIGFSADDFSLEAIRFDHLDEFEPLSVKLAVERLVMESREKSARLGDRLNRVALLLIDGLSHREEMFAHALQNCLGPVPLIGGSAADGMALQRCCVLYDGAFRDDCATLAILASRRPMKVFCQRYGAPTSGRAIITRADPVARRVREINGEVAAFEYARLLGISRQALSPAVFAAHPLMIRIGGQYYARSVQSQADDGSLVFQSAVARGLVTSVGSLHDPVAALADTMRSVQEELGQVDAMLVFDDVMNREAARSGDYLERLERLYAGHGLIGFHTYGEQFRELHLNQSLVGLAVGSAVP
jgi:hypothetical protein